MKKICFIFICTTWLIAFIFYLFLTAGSYYPDSKIFLWCKEEIYVGVVVAFIASLISYKFLFKSLSLPVLNPKRIFIFIGYIIFVFFPAMVVANFDVAYRVITGKINPGIVKISHKYKTDLAIMLLANSITLTPGTLSVDVDEENNLYIHWIYVKKLKPTDKDVCGKFPVFVRLIAE